MTHVHLELFGARRASPFLIPHDTSRTSRIKLTLPPNFLRHTQRSSVLLRSFIISFVSPMLAILISFARDVSHRLFLRPGELTTLSHLRSLRQVGQVLRLNRPLINSEVRLRRNTARCNSPRPLHLKSVKGVVPRSNIFRIIPVILLHHDP